MSQATVSWVLNGKTGQIGVSQAVRERIMEAARQMRYRPHAMARAMRAGRFFNIGYFATTRGVVDHDFPEFRAGVYDAAAEKEYHVLQVRIAPGPSGLGEALPKVFREAHLDALIVNEIEPLGSDLSSAMEDSGLPIVHLNRRTKLNGVYVDEEAGMTSLLDHLLARGYRDLIYVDLRERKPGCVLHHSRLDRERAFLESMKSRGLAVREKIFEYDLFGVDSAMSFHGIPEDVRRTRFHALEREVIAWLRSGDLPEVAVCYSDEAAVRVQMYALAAGVPIPGRMGLAGFNAEDRLDLFSLRAITTMRIPRYNMAREAVRMALDLIANAKRQPSVGFVPELSIGETTPGPAAAGA